MSNPDMGEAASVVLSFHLETAPAEQRASPSHSIEFPVEEQGRKIFNAVVRFHGIDVTIDHMAFLYSFKFRVQGDHAGCSLGVVDIKAKVVF